MESPLNLLTNAIRVRHLPTGYRSSGNSSATGTPHRGAGQARLATRGARCGERRRRDNARCRANGLIGASSHLLEPMPVGGNGGEKVVMRRVTDAEVGTCS